MDHIMILAEHVTAMLESDESSTNDSNNNNNNKSSNNNHNSGLSPGTPGLTVTRMNSSNIRDPRTWNVTQVVQWFDGICQSQFMGRFNELLANLDFDGRKLLSADNETLEMDLRMSDETERQMVLAEIHVLKKVLKKFYFFNFFIHFLFIFGLFCCFMF